MQAYSIDLRIKVIEAYNRGEGSIRILAKRFSIHWRTLANWIKHFKTEKSVGPKVQRYGSLPKLDQGATQTLEKLVIAKPDSTLSELSEQVCALTGKKLSTSGIWRALGRLGLTRKKRVHQQLKPIDQTSGKHFKTTLRK